MIMKFLNLVTGTPVGDFSMIVSPEGDRGVVVASGFECVEKLYERCGLNPSTLVEEHTHPYITLVQEYFAGRLEALSLIPVRASGSPFQESVWSEMRKISPGKVSSYKSLAERIGRPHASRAVGTACGGNHLILFIPCHRVIRTDGSIGDYVYGNAVKKKLLEHEQMSLS